MPPTPTAPSAILPLAQSVPGAAPFCAVAGRSAVMRVIESLLGAGRVPADRIVIVAAAPLVGLARRDAAALGAVTVLECPPPATRPACIALGLDYLDLQSDSAVLVHDHRFPLASSAATDRVIAGLAAGHAVVAPALPMTDTVKEVDGRGAVLRTIDRRSLQSVQYPRGYRAATLASLVSVADADDEFAAAVSVGEVITLVEGDADAVVADLPADAALLDAIIASRHPD